MLRGSMIDFAETYSKELVALAAVLIAFLLNSYFKPRAKLVYGFRNAFTFLVDEPIVDPTGKEIAKSQFVNTASLSVSNIGKETAKNIEVAFNWRPQFINIWPARHFETRDSAHGRHSLFLESLAPGEVFGVELLSINRELPALTSVRSDECTGTQVVMTPQQVQPPWKIGLAAYCILAGIAATAYFAAFVIQLIAAD